MGNNIVGATNILNVFRPFCFDLKSQKIILYIGGILLLQEPIFNVIGEVYGEIYEKNIFFKMSKPLIPYVDVKDGDKKSKAFLGNHESEIEYYIRGYDSNSQYEKIIFQFPELDYFLYSDEMASIDNDKIIISLKQQLIKKLDIDYQKTKINILFLNEKNIFLMENLR